jgi:CRP-like cAMP-binding protein
MKIKEFEPEDILVKEGDEGDSFFIIASGIVKIFSNNKGSEFERMIYPGAYFGEAALINNQKRAAS